MNTDVSIVFLGASGAVGGAALGHLLGDPRVAKLTLLLRRPLDPPAGNRATPHLVDTVNPSTYQHLLVDHTTAICTLGVGEPSKVSKAEFKRIDHDAVLAFATACRAAGVRHFILLGSVGSSAASRSYYLQSKGALRDAIEAMGFESVTTAQPSMILTPTNRYGLSQAILLAVWPWVSHLLLGSLSKYRGIPIDQLGKAIAHSAMSPQPGHHRLHWAEMMRLDPSRPEA